MQEENRKPCVTPGCGKPRATPTGKFCAECRDKAKLDGQAKGAATRKVKKHDHPPKKAEDLCPVPEDMPPIQSEPWPESLLPDGSILVGYDPETRTASYVKEAATPEVRDGKVTLIEVMGLLTAMNCPGDIGNMATTVWGYLYGRGLAE